MWLSAGWWQIKASLLRGLLEKIFFFKQKKETHKKKALSIPSYFRIYYVEPAVEATLWSWRANTKDHREALRPLTLLNFRFIQAGTPYPVFLVKTL